MENHQNDPQETLEQPLTLQQVQACIEFLRMGLPVQLPVGKWLQVLEAAKAWLEANALDISRRYKHREN